ncbi:hypothetical protein Sjap_009071 [Stephania japonica]|uniref:Uncharacterized protein n=1 Tax=Stephania japonica TaxID=461633 RepID=A0AAP0JQT9_9MAGN
MSTFTSLLTTPMLVLLLLLQFLVISPSTSLDLGMHSSKYCNGSIAECNEEHEMLMESEISHRLLLGQPQKTLAYRALKPDTGTCGVNGKSCLNQANSRYTRPCFKSKGCRGGS